MTTEIPGFEGAVVIGSLEEDIREFAKSWGCSSRRDDKIQLDISVAEPPIMLCSKQIGDLYANSKYDEITSLENSMENDLEGIHENIRKKGDEAFTKVQYEGKEYYVAFNKFATFWIYSHDEKEVVSVNENGEKLVSYMNHFQVGKYSKNGRVTGTVDYVFTGGSAALSAIFYGMVSKMAQTILQEGTKLVLKSLTNQMIKYAAKHGLKTTIKIVTVGASKFIGGAVFVLAFFGLRAFWKWANRRYSIKLTICNRSETDTLYLSDFYSSNAKMICDEQDMRDALETDIPKMIAPGNEITPPGFNPVESIEEICYYVTYFFENDSTFFQGCGIALNAEIGEKGSGKGFRYGFDCPRFSSNRQKASEDLNKYQNSKNYYDSGPWNSNPLKFALKTENIPVSVTLDALNGNDGNFYPSITFNHQR